MDLHSLFHGSVPDAFHRPCPVHTDRQPCPDGFSRLYRLLGRSVTIDRADQTLVAFFYAFVFLWIFGSMFTRVYRFFIPIALMSTALMIGVIAVQPFIYGIFLVMICGLLFLPMLRDSHTNKDYRIYPIKI